MRLHKSENVYERIKKECRLKEKCNTANSSKGIIGCKNEKVKITTQLLASIVDG